MYTPATLFSPTHLTYKHTQAALDDLLQRYGYLKLSRYRLVTMFDLVHLGPITTEQY